MSGYTPCEESIDKLRTKLGECTAIAPPRVFLARQKRNPFLAATEMHEHAHAVLMRGTTYGICEQVLYRLLDVGCPHVESEILREAISGCLRNAFVVHEGFATLWELEHVAGEQPSTMPAALARLPDDYRHSCSRLMTAASLLGADHETMWWTALHVALVCLSPPLFGPLLDRQPWVNGDLAALLSRDEFSAAARLERLIDEGQRSNLGGLASRIREATAPALIRQQQPITESAVDEFFALAGGVIQSAFSEAVPGFYASFDAFALSWPSMWEQLRAKFAASGCECLDEFSCHCVCSRDLLRDTEATRPVAAADYRDHRGAVEVSDPSDIALEPGTQFYTSLAFGDVPEPFVICTEPLRLLREGALYARFGTYRWDGGVLEISTGYGFRLYASAEIPGALSRIAELPGTVVCAGYGPTDRVLARLSTCHEQGIRGVYLRVDGVTADGFYRLVDALPSRPYHLILLYDSAYGDRVIFLKDPEEVFHVMFPVAGATLAAVESRLPRMATRLVQGEVEPTWTDRLCFRHLLNCGW